MPAKKEKTLEDLEMEARLEMVAQQLGISVRAARRYLPQNRETK